MSGIVAAPTNANGEKLSKKSYAHVQWRSVLMNILICAFVAASVFVFLLYPEYGVYELCTLVPIAWYVRRRREKRLAKQRALLQHASQDASQEDEQLLEDPLRWCFLPSTGSLRANMKKAVPSDNEFASFKFLVLHRPTHDKEREKSGDYPYSWHFSGRKRIWEVRVQVRFKQPNKKTIFFGLEFLPSDPGAKVSWAAEKIKHVMLGAIRGQIGNEFHHSSGDDPSSVVGEAEPGTIALPLWALDQFHIADPGTEPDLGSDLNGVGTRRTEVGVKKYAQLMKELQNNLSSEKVYTFCFWGVAQFLDVMNWEMCGIFPGVRIPANSLCGKPPVYVVAYQLADPESEEKRHLISRKCYYFKVALWSNKVPPNPSLLRELTLKKEDAVSAAPDTSVKRRKSVAGRCMMPLSRAVRAIC